jgi:hypothetical protein
MQVQKIESQIRYAVNAEAWEVTLIVDGLTAIQAGTGPSPTQTAKLIELRDTLRDASASLIH